MKLLKAFTLTIISSLVLMSGSLRVFGMEGSSGAPAENETPAARAEREARQASIRRRLEDQARYLQRLQGRPMPASVAFAEEQEQAVAAAPVALEEAARGVLRAQHEVVKAALVSAGEEAVSEAICQSCKSPLFDVNCPQKLILLSCQQPARHAFHVDCVKARFWSGEQACPTCRGEISEAFLVQEGLQEKSHGQCLNIVEVLKAAINGSQTRKIILSSADFERVKNLLVDLGDAESERLKAGETQVSQMVEAPWELLDKVIQQAGQTVLRLKSHRLAASLGALFFLSHEKLQRTFSLATRFAWELCKEAGLGEVHADEYLVKIALNLLGNVVAHFEQVVAAGQPIAAIEVEAVAKVLVDIMLNSSTRLQAPLAPLLRRFLALENFGEQCFTLGCMRENVQLLVPLAEMMAQLLWLSNGPVKKILCQKIHGWLSENDSRRLRFFMEADLSGAEMQSVLGVIGGLGMLDEKNCSLFAPVCKRLLDYLLSNSSVMHLGNRYTSILKRFFHASVSMVSAMKLREKSAAKDLVEKLNVQLNEAKDQLTAIFKQPQESFVNAWLEGLRIFSTSQGGPIFNEESKFIQEDMQDIFVGLLSRQETIFKALRWLEACIPLTARWRFIERNIALLDQIISANAQELIDGEVLALVCSNCIEGAPAEIGDRVWKLFEDGKLHLTNEPSALAIRNLAMIANCCSDTTFLKLTEYLVGTLEENLHGFMTGGNNDSYKRVMIAMILLAQRNSGLVEVDALLWRFVARHLNMIMGSNCDGQDLEAVIGVVSHLQHGRPASLFNNLLLHLLARKQDMLGRLFMAGSEQSMYTLFVALSTMIAHAVSPAQRSQPSEIYWVFDFLIAYKHLLGRALANTTLKYAYEDALLRVFNSPDKTSQTREVYHERREKVLAHLLGEDCECLRHLLSSEQPMAITGTTLMFLQKLQVFDPKVGWCLVQHGRELRNRLLQGTLKNEFNADGTLRLLYGWLLDALKAWEAMSDQKTLVARLAAIFSSPDGLELKVAHAKQADKKLIVALLEGRAKLDQLHGARANRTDLFFPNLDIAPLFTALLSSRETVGAALKFLGHSVSDVSVAVLANACQTQMSALLPKEASILVGIARLASEYDMSQPEGSRGLSAGRESFEIIRQRADYMGEIFGKPATTAEHGFVWQALAMLTTANNEVVCRQDWIWKLVCHRFTVIGLLQAGEQRASHVFQAAAQAVANEGAYMSYCLLNLLPAKVAELADSLEGGFLELLTKLLEELKPARVRPISPNVVKWMVEELERSAYCLGAGISKERTFAYLRCVLALVENVPQCADGIAEFLKGKAARLFSLIQHNPAEKAWILRCVALVCSSRKANASGGLAVKFLGKWDELIKPVLEHPDDVELVNAILHMLERCALGFDEVRIGARRCSPIVSQHRALFEGLMQSPNFRDSCCYFFLHLISGLQANDELIMQLWAFIQPHIKRLILDLSNANGNSDFCRWSSLKVVVNKVEVIKRAVTELCQADVEVGAIAARLFNFKPV